MYKEMKGLTINKKVLEIWAGFYDKASDLDESKEDEVTDFLDENGDDAGRLYIEDYMASESTAREFCWGQ